MPERGLYLYVNGRLQRVHATCRILCILLSLFLFLFAADISSDSMCRALLDCSFLLWVVGGNGAGIPIGKPCVGELMEFTEARCEALQLLRYPASRVLFCFALLMPSIKFFFILKFQEFCSFALLISISRPPHPTPCQFSAFCSFPIFYSIHLHRIISYGR